MLWIAVTAALVVVVIGGGLFYLGGRNSPIGATPATTPTLAPTQVPSPTPAATPTAAALSSPSIVASSPAAQLGGPVPTQLQASWMGANRPSGTGEAGVALRFDASTFHLSISNDLGNPYTGGEAGSTGSGNLNLGSELCQANSSGPGQYSYTLSPSGRVLTLAVVSDSCSSRAGDIAGTYWLMGCKDPGTGCLGDLDPGTYASQYIRPTVVDPWSPQFGGVTYTVPEGWANYADLSEWFGLTPSAAFADTTAQDPFPASGVDIFANARPISAPCAETAGSAAKNAHDLLMSLANNVTATAPTPISVAGLSGFYVDVSINPQGPCPTGGSYFYAAQSGQGLDATEANRLIALDQPDGHILAIVIRSQTADLTSLIQDAMPVIGSMHFK